AVVEAVVHETGDRRLGGPAGGVVGEDGGGRAGEVHARRHLGPAQPHALADGGGHGLDARGEGAAVAVEPALGGAAVQHDDAVRAEARAEQHGAADERLFERERLAVRIVQPGRAGVDHAADGGGAQAEPASGGADLAQVHHAVDDGALGGDDGVALGVAPAGPAQPEVAADVRAGQAERALDGRALLDQQGGAELGVGQVEGAPAGDGEGALAADLDGAERAHAEVHAAVDLAPALDAERAADGDAGGADGGAGAAAAGVGGAGDGAGGVDRGITDHDMSGNTGVSQVDAPADQRTAAGLVVDEE